MAESEQKERAMERQQPQVPGPVEEMERWLDEYFPRAWMRRWGWPSWGELTRPIERLAPRVDVLDRDAEVLVRAEVPGVAKDDLEVSLNERAVTIKGSIRREEKDEEGEYFRAEIARGEFSRTVALPAAVDADKAKAKFHDGILELELPKVAKSKRRRVEIK
jgi:HSP20 family protein